jgi:hypothetical protein
LSFRFIADEGCTREPTYRIALSRSRPGSRGAAVRGNSNRRGGAVGSAGKWTMLHFRRVPIVDSYCIAIRSSLIAVKSGHADFSLGGRSGVSHAQAATGTVSDDAICWSSERRFTPVLP